MYRIDVWYKPYGCFCPGVNTYANLDSAKERAKKMRSVGHRVKIVPVDSPKYTN